MRPKRDPVPRARDWAWLGGTALLGILGAGVTAAAVVLWENIDIRRLVPQLAEAPPPIPMPQAPPPAARPGITYSAVLFDSPRNRAFFPDPGYYDRVLSDWEALVSETGGRVRRAGAAGELAALSSADLLVLPAAPCLSDAEWSAVRGHLGRGGSLVTNWALGARDAACGWKGWESVVEITGAEDVREVPPRQGLFLTVPAGVVLSPGLDPGARIELRPEPTLALRLTGPRVYWSDWALNPQPDESGGGADAAALTRVTEQGGRVVWFGMRLEQPVTVQDATRLRRLVQNGVSWAAGMPLAAPAAWPDAMRAALVFSLDVEDEPRNAIATAQLLRQRGLRGSFYVVSQLVLDDPQLAKILVAAGEVGSQTADHTPVAGLTPQDQGVRLRRSWGDVETWTGVEPAGLHPPEETFDANTLEAWSAAGGKYLLATNEARSASPELHLTSRGSVVLLPRLLKDDYNIIVQDRVIRATSLTEAYLSGLRKQNAIGGFAVVSGHTQIMRPGARMGALGSVMDAALDQGDWWIATAAEVAEWWEARSQVALSFASPSSIRGSGLASAGIGDLLVSAPPGVGIERLWVDVVLPSAHEELVVLVDGVPVDFTAADWGVRVPLGDLTAGATRTVTFAVMGSGPSRQPSPLPTP